MRDMMKLLSKGKFQERMRKNSILFNYQKNRTLFFASSDSDGIQKLPKKKFLILKGGKRNKKNSYRK